MKQVNAIIEDADKEGKNMFYEERQGIIDTTENYIVGEQMGDEEKKKQGTENKVEDIEWKWTKTFGC